MDDQAAQSGGQVDDQAGSFAGAPDDTQSVTTFFPVHGGNKEAEVVTPVDMQAMEAVEVKEPDQIPAEVSGWVERLERGENIHLSQPVTHQGQILVAPTQPQSVKIILPLTKDAVEKGLHVKIVDSLRWLAEWCVRIIKKFPGKVVYRRA